MEDIILPSLIVLAPMAFVVGFLAVAFAKSKRTGRFLATLLGIYVLANLAIAASDSSPHLGFVGELFLGLAMTSPLAAAYGFFLGWLVRSGAQTQSIAWSTVGLHIVAAPVTLLLGLYLTCQFGHDCL